VDLCFVPSNVDVYSPSVPAAIIAFASASFFFTTLAVFAFLSLSFSAAVAAFPTEPLLPSTVDIDFFISEKITLISYLIIIKKIIKHGF